MAREVDLSDWMHVLPEAFDNHLCSEHGAELVQDAEGRYACDECEPGTDREPVTYEVLPLSGRDFRYHAMTSTRQEQRRGSKTKSRKAQHAANMRQLVRMEAALLSRCVRNVKNYSVWVRDHATDDKTHVHIMDGAEFAEFAENAFQEEARGLVSDASRLAPALGEAST